MTANVQQAWLIHKQWSGETSARLTLFCRESGLIRTYFKGARSKKNAGNLELFTPLWVSLDSRHDRIFVSSIETMTLPVPLNGHGLFSGLYINELLYHAQALEHPDEQLFEAYEITLQALSQSCDALQLEAALRRFEWTLLTSCGYPFSWSCTVEGTPVVEDVLYQFSACRGFVPAATGIPGRYLLAIAQDNLDEALHLKAAKQVMRKAIDHLLGGRELKSRLLYS